MFCSTIIESYECFTHKDWRYMNIKRSYSIIYYVISGTAYYQLNGKTVQFEKNHLYILPSNVTYSLFEDPNDKMYHTYVHAFLYPEVKEVINIDVSKDDFLQMIIKHLREYIKKKKPNIYTQKLTEMLVSYISDKNKHTSNHIHAQIKQYIDENFIEVFKTNNLSNIFNYSKPHIIKIFKDAYNITPKQYCDDLVLKHMLNLLKEGYSLTEITELFNFSSLASFSRFFKNKYGSNPSQFVKLITEDKKI